MESKLKHLEIIQATINRMSTNSFLLKGWSVTLVSVLIALTDQDSYKRHFLIAYLPIIVFWLLNGYFLSQERRYRDLYDEVRKRPEKEIDFSMETKKFNKGVNTWFSSIFSSVLAVFYGVLLITVVIVSWFYVK